MSDRCDIVGGKQGGWYCKTHDCKMGWVPTPPLQGCMKTRQPTNKEKQWLEAEQRRLRYRVLVGTTTQDDRVQMADIKKLLGGARV